MKRRNHWSWRYDKPKGDSPLWLQMVAWAVAIGLIVLIVGMILGW